VAAALRAAGFAAEDVWIGGPRADRVNLVARLRAAESARTRAPVLLLSHLDVVAADPADWSVPPFAVTERDGFLYGRGTLDIKGEVADLVANFARLKREGFVPARDLVLALTADEEEGAYNGVAWLLAQHRDWLDVAYALNTDAAGLQEERGRPRRMPIQTSEKGYLTLQLEVTAPGGHSALPERENAIFRLAAALGRLEGLEFPAALNATTRGSCAQLAREGGPLAEAYRGALAEPPDAHALATLSAQPWPNAQLRTVCTPTLLAAGHAENALPERASATIQCRLLPGVDAEAVRAVLRARIADERVAMRTTSESVRAPESPIDPAVFAAVAAATHASWPGVPVQPVMDPWTSDGSLLRAAGIPVYGVSGIAFDPDDVRSHGPDERISERAFAEGVEFMHELLRRLGAPQRARALRR
jgi:acetylornithine deacetylase/succinyl-diaminopimelate desuccinylase-like protein